jgi:glycerophosphoryl diester phosphodiesterase
VHENALPVVPKMSITIIKAGSHWIFKHFFEDAETFRELADYYDKVGYRFILKTPGERNLVTKLLERRGYAVALVENSRGYVVKLSHKSRYAGVLKNSLAQIETPEWRIFLMRDQNAVKEALRQGAKMVEVDVQF